MSFTGTSMDQDSVSRRAQWLQQLAAAWRAAYPARAQGGAWALAGFHYQFLIALRATVEQWLGSDPNERGSVGVFTELLSDIVSSSLGEPVVVTQVKRRYTGSRLREALAELWEVWLTALQLTPQGTPNLAFRVVAATSALVDLRGAVERWCPDGVDAADPRLRAFRAQLTVDVDAEPERELLQLLVNGLRVEDPRATVHAWVGRLVEAAATSPASLRQIAKEIWNDLVQLQHRAEKSAGSRIYLWSTADRQPATVAPGPYLVGQRPMPRHLRLGFFALRRHIIDSILLEAKAWMDPHPAASDTSLRVPVFWIGGRSGSGKSVALLQAIAEIHDEGYGPVLWLGAHTGTLPEAIRRSRSLHGEGQPVIIALDDPYAPVAQNESAALWQDALAELEALRQSDNYPEIPLLLCCGPTEQGERLASDFRDDVSVTFWEMPEETTADLATLRHWYWLRTGEEPPHVGDSNVLLVLLFFEWRVGQPLPEFAERFRRRLLDSEGGSDLLALFARILALNRIYVGYPLAALKSRISPHQEMMIARLRGEHHLVESPDDDRPGVWLAHPHLSDAIYTAWYPPGKTAPVRREHLASGIEDARLHGENPSQKQAPLWALSRTLDHRCDRVIADRLAADDVAEILLRTYPGRSGGDAASVPLWQLPVWVEISAMAPSLPLAPDPVTLAVWAVRSEPVSAPGLRLTCHKLLEHLASQPESKRVEARDAILDLLERALDWHEWPAIAADMASRVTHPRLWSVVARWTVTHGSLAATPGLLTLSLKAAPNDSHLRDAALRVIGSAPDRLGWGDVAQDLVRACEEAGDVPLPVLEWVGRHRTSFNVRFALGRLVQLRVPAAVRWGVEWAGIWRRESTANFVLEPLAHLEDSPPRVKAWALEWIRAGHPHAGMMIKLLLQAHGPEPEILDASGEWLCAADAADGSWPIGWDHYRKHVPTDERVVERAYSWFDAAPADHRAWPFIWRGLWEAFPGNERLVARAHAWFDAAPPEHGSWTFVWQDLWEAFPGDEGLVARAYAWLDAVPAGHVSWYYIWRELWATIPGDHGLVARARAWLADAPPEHGSWQHVWQALWKAFPGDEELVARARAWLEAAPSEHASWKYVWEDLWEAFPGDEHLVTRAHAWLETAPTDHPSWHHVWQTLWKASPGDEQLVARARAWLHAGPMEPGSWHYVWQDLWRASPGDADMARVARSWLAAVPPEHGAWAFVWRVLWKEFPLDEDLAERGRAWLQTTFTDFLAWKSVWEKLRKSYPEDERLVELAREWLAAAPPEHGSWQHVWLELWKTSSGDADLIEAARVWLRCAPAAHASWAFAWRELWGVLPGDEYLVEVAREWLGAAPPEHGAWAFVWRLLWTRFPLDEELAERGRAWLRFTSTEFLSWKSVWEKLRKSFPGDESLVEVTRAWLAAAPAEHASWQFVWGELWKALPGDARLVELARTWLKDAPAEHGSWKFVWEELWKALPGDAHLVELAQTWLKDAPVEHGSWSYVWNSLWKAFPGDERLVESGRAWLAAAPAEHASWQYVWKGLWTAFPGDAHLREQARAWLAVEPPTHRSWAYVWLMLRRAADPPEELEALAKRFLAANTEKHPKRLEVWKAIARDDQAPPDAQNLLHATEFWRPDWPGRWIRWFSAEAPSGANPVVEAGVAWLESSFGYLLWASVFLRLWTIPELRSRLDPLGREWILRNPDGRRADEVRTVLAAQDSRVVLRE